jgi:hypothetical protein
MECHINVLKFRHVLFNLLYNVSEKTTASIFMVEKQACKQGCKKQLKAENCLAYFSSLKMGIVRSSETSMNYQTTRLYILQDSILEHNFNPLKPSGYCMYHLL